MFYTRAASEDKSTGNTGIAIDLEALISESEDLVYGQQ
jgi:hypothetical protein